jgi:hypothetical protein
MYFIPSSIQKKKIHFIKIHIMQFTLRIPYQRQTELEKESVPVRTSVRVKNTRKRKLLSYWPRCKLNSKNYNDKSTFEGHAFNREESLTVQKVYQYQVGYMS